MNDSTTGGSASNGGAETTAAAPEAAAATGDVPGSHLMRDAISLLKQHPLGAVATVAAATAFIEVELAVGILAGLGASALLVNQSGPEARQRVLAGGKWALDRARTAVAKAKAPPPQVAPPV
jgi:hypothetical protein